MRRHIVAPKDLNTAQFNLRDLGVLDGPRERGFDAVVSIASVALEASTVVLMTFDAESGSIFLRASHGMKASVNPLLGIPAHGSITSEIISKNKSLVVSDLAASDFSQPVEGTIIEAAAYIGTPVHGPANEPIGALLAGDANPRVWTDRQKASLEEIAYLTTQIVMLKASFETLRLIKQQPGIPVV